MILCLAFCSKDEGTAIRLAKWIAELGGTSRHDLFLGYSSDTTPDAIADILRPHFRNIGGIRIDEQGFSYPASANWMWTTCARTIGTTLNEPWLWMEPDAVPLVPEWMDRIEDEYKVSGKAFSLNKVITPTRSHNSGVGVYPGRVVNYTDRLWEVHNTPWDVFFAEDFTPHTHHTKLIHDKFFEVWDDPKSGSPVFPNVESLSIIEPNAVLFHRCKDSSLLDRLKDRLRQERESRGGVISTRGGLISSEIAGATPAPATDEKEALFAKIAELEARLALAASPKAKVIYAYHEKVEAKYEDQELMDLCRQSWAKRGWELRVLGQQDARNHPYFKDISTADALHSKGDFRIYINACYFRWLAFEMAAREAGGAIFTVDLDVINYGISPDKIPSLDTNVVQILSDSPTPCLTSGTEAAYRGVIDCFMRFAKAPHTETAHLRMSISDQNILDSDRSAWKGCPTVVEYLSRGWETANLVHYPFDAMDIPGGRGKRIKQIRPIESLPKQKEAARKNKKCDTRTPAQIQAAKDRMAKARAGRKTVAA